MCILSIVCPPDIAWAILDIQIRCYPVFTQIINNIWYSVNDISQRTNCLAFEIFFFQLCLMCNFIWNNLILFKYIVEGHNASRRNSMVIICLGKCNQRHIKSNPKSYIILNSVLLAYTLPLLQTPLSVLWLTYFHF